MALRPEWPAVIRQFVEQHSVRHAVNLRESTSINPGSHEDFRMIPREQGNLDIGEAGIKTTGNLS
jgi:hypothetical protein